MITEPDVALTDWAALPGGFVHGFGLAWWRGREPAARHALLGLAALLAGAVVPWRGIPLHAVYFDHNALSHVIAAGGRLLLFGGVRELGASAPGEVKVTRC